MDRLVTIYQRKGKILVIPTFRTTAGFHVEKGPARVIENNDLFEIGNAVFQAAAEYEEGLPIPDWKTYENGTQEAAGVHSDAEFHRELRGCLIKMKAEEIEVTPEENRGTKNGLVPLREAVLIVPKTEDPGIVGGLVQEGLSRAK